GAVAGAAGAGVATGAAGAAGAGAGLAAAAGASTADVAAPAASISSSTLPSPTVSPILTLLSLTTPAAGEGTSMVALSDSSVTSESSGLMVSPTLTRISMTGTSLKSPMSGTLTSVRAISVLLERNGVQHDGRTRGGVEFNAGLDADFGDLNGVHVGVVGGVHGAERKVAARTHAPEAVEFEHFAVGVHAVDAGRIRNQRGDLRGLVGVV